MKTLNLSEAASLLKLHPQTVLQRARCGEIPAAKPGKRWVFIYDDLINWLRNQYNQPRQDVSKEVITCSLKGKNQIFGITNLLSKEKQYTDLLAPKIKLKPKK